MITAIIGTSAALALAAFIGTAILDDHPWRPRKLCGTCAHQSRNHPAGPLHRYTRRRNKDGDPECHRHR